MDYGHQCFPDIATVELVVYSCRPRMRAYIEDLCLSQDPRESKQGVVQAWGAHSPSGEPVEAHVGTDMAWVSGRGVECGGPNQYTLWYFHIVVVASTCRSVKCLISETLNRKL
jgi:hypothetical protein